MSAMTAAAPVRPAVRLARATDSLVVGLYLIADVLGAGAVLAIVFRDASQDRLLGAFLTFAIAANAASAARWAARRAYIRHRFRRVYGRPAPLVSAHTAHVGRLTAAVAADAGVTLGTGSARAVAAVLMYGGALIVGSGLTLVALGTVPDGVAGVILGFALVAAARRIARRAGL